MSEHQFPFAAGAFGPFAAPVQVLPGIGTAGLIAYRKVYFVDGDNGSDDTAGLSPDQSFKTIQKAVDTVKSRDAIIVLPHTAGGDYDETVTTRQLDSTTREANYVTIMGATNTKWAYDAPQLLPNTGNGICINVRAPGYRISGFRFATPAADVECIRVDFNQAGRTADTNWSPGTQIDNCSFLGAVAAGFGIRSVGSPPAVRIMENQFIGFTRGCIYTVVSTAITAQLWYIADNIVMDCTHFLGNSGTSGGLDNSIITRNIVSIGKNNTMVKCIDLGGGNGNVITLNYFPGTYGSTLYPNVGGTNEWAGNTSQDGSAADRVLVNTPWTAGKPNT